MYPAQYRFKSPDLNDISVISVDGRVAIIISIII